MEKQMPPCANSWRNCSIGRNHPSLWFRDRQDAIKSSKFRTFPCRKPQPSSEINKSPSEENLCDPIAKTTSKKILGLLPQLIPPEGASSLCDSVAKATRSLGKEGSARGEEPLFKAVFASRTKTHPNKKRDAKKQPLQPSPHRVNYFADFSVFPEPAGAWQEYARPHRNFPTTDEWDAATGR